MLEENSRVRLVTNRHRDEGAVAGMMGYILEVYDDGNYEVEFSDPDTGETVAQVVVSDVDIEAAPEA